MFGCGVWRGNFHHWLSVRHHNKKQIATLYWITSQIIIIFIFQTQSWQSHQWRILGSWWREDGVTESNSLKVNNEIDFHKLLFIYDHVTCCWLTYYLLIRSRDDLASSSQSDMFSSHSEDQWFSKEKLYKVRNKSKIQIKL